MQTPPRPTLLPPDPDPAALAAWRAELAAAQASPWLASLFARRLGALAVGLEDLRQRLAALPRRFRRAWVRRWAIGLPLAALLLALTNGGARAASITVDPTGSGCTLEDAIAAANSDSAAGSCPAGSGPDTIGFANPNTTYTLFSNYGGPLPLITSQVTIQGNGTTTLDGEGNLRSFAVEPGADLTLNNLTITGGNATAGGGIYVNDGTLTATSVTVQGNFAADDGGGLFGSDASITLTDCTISGNSADDDGGGVTVEYSYLTVRSSTISGNTAGDVGGGLDPDSSYVYLYDSTVRGNSAGDDGGGIDADSSLLVIYGSTINNNTTDEDGGGINAYYYCDLVLTNATISGNSAQGNGGGIHSNGSYGGIQFSTVTGNRADGAGSGIYSIYTEGSGIDIRNSIVAAQASGSDCGGREPNSYGYNIESGTSCDFTEPGDQQSVSPASLDLGPLALNAPGSTETHALSAGSAALNQIPNLDNGCGTDVTDDQRGVVRPQFAACDVGAYELEAQAEPTPPPTAATLTRFGAQVDPTGRVQIAWETGSEIDLVGFRVERAVLGEWGDPEVAAGSWTAVGALVAAQGGASHGAQYRVSDSMAPGHYAYRLIIVNAAAPPELHGPVTARVDALRAFLPVTLQR